MVAFVRPPTSDEMQYTGDVIHGRRTLDVKVFIVFAVLGALLGLAIGIAEAAANEKAHRLWLHAHIHGCLRGCPCHFRHAHHGHHPLAASRPAACGSQHVSWLQSPWSPSSSGCSMPSSSSS